MSNLRETFLKSNTLSSESIELILKCWTKKRSVKAKEPILNPITNTQYLYFVTQGCVRLFVTNTKNEEINLGFGYENTFITCFQSYIEEKPSILNIEAILDTEILCISKQDIENLKQENKDISLWYQGMLENTLTGHIHRQIELLTLSPQERYEVFLKRSGHLLNTIPLKLIASYLMMKPETLSRIRAKVS